MTQETAPRTRTRQRPHTSTDSGEQRATGATASKHDDTNHKPVTTEQLYTAPPGVLMARVSVADGVTLNMGDYNSFRREVRLEMDVQLPGEADNGGVLTQEQEDTLERVHNTVADWVQDKLDQAMDDARAYFGE